MSTEEIIETFIDKGVKAYRRNYKNCPEGIRLFRHEPVVLNGITFTCWREYTIYKMGQYIQEIFPNISIDIELDGNNSTLSLEMSDDEQQRLNQKLYDFLKKENLL